ncbi:MAG: ribonuclease HI, partial [Planctomycetes bacterium]|nr:ribonuclease HI [Planctomycetota bacterium]
DGACSGNPGPGGWGALLRFEDGSVQEFGGADPATTNNRMELTAALALLEALKVLPRHPDLAIRTDSKYLIDGFSKWIQGWKRKGWRTASGSPVLNRDLWERLDQARLGGVPLIHVKGHSGDPDNDRCDAIAVAFASLNVLLPSSAYTAYQWLLPPCDAGHCTARPSGIGAGSPRAISISPVPVTPLPPTRIR